MRDLDALGPLPWIECGCGIGYFVSLDDRKQGFTRCDSRYGCGKEIQHPREAPPAHSLPAEKTLPPETQ